jgi:hypothetical protein
MADSARMQQPYAALKLAPSSLSVIANRPVGVGESSLPTPTVMRRTTLDPRRTVSVRRKRSTSSSSAVRE